MSLRLFLPYLLLLTACTQELKPATPSYFVEHGEIVVPESSPFLKHLEITSAVATPRGEVAFKTVGQIIALANSSSVLSNSAVAWVELDAELTSSVGLHLTAFTNAVAGTAFGTTLLPAEYTAQIHLGENVEIARYGLKKSDIQGTVVKIQTRGDLGSAYVTFEIKKGQDWYPGTNIEVHFPLLHVKTVEVPTTSVLHEGLREFVLQQDSNHHFKVIPVFIISETPETAQIIGVNSGDSIVASGAILLKPEIHNLIHDEKELHHVLQ